MTTAYDVSARPGDLTTLGLYLPGLVVCVTRFRSQQYVYVTALTYRGFEKMTSTDGSDLLWRHEDEPRI